MRAPGTLGAKRSWLRRIALCALALLVAGAAQAAPRDQARRMHDRLVGTPPSAQVLADMTTLIAAGDPIAAANLAMQDPGFYSSALKNFVTPWTNVEGSVFADLNDYSATIIGMIRDDVPFDQVLSADLVYRGVDGVVPSAPSMTDNDHYVQLESQRIDLSDPSQFEGVSQAGLYGPPFTPNDTAGVVTTRAAAEAFFSAGTNRRMWRFTSMNFLCRDLEDTKDITRPVDRIRQDVSRSPGGDSSIFHNHCTGCHSGMDPLSGAYAYYEWDAAQQRLVFTPGQVSGKHLINASTFPFGHVTTDDRWDNFWREGPNGALGWGATAAGGYGAKTLGIEVAGSRAFAVCQVEKVFRQVCFRPATSQADADAIDAMADTFEQQGYSLKRVFAETAVYCMGQ